MIVEITYALNSANRFICIYPNLQTTWNNIFEEAHCSYSEMLVLKPNTNNTHWEWQLIFWHCRRAASIITFIYHSDSKKRLFYGIFHVKALFKGKQIYSVVKKKTKHQHLWYNEAAVEQHRVTAYNNLKLEGKNTYAFESRPFSPQATLQNTKQLKKNKKQGIVTEGLMCLLTPCDEEQPSCSLWYPVVPTGPPALLPPLSEKESGPMSLYDTFWPITNVTSLEANPQHQCRSTHQGGLLKTQLITQSVKSPSVPS